MYKTPSNTQRRKSLGDVFSTVKTRLSRDKLADRREVENKSNEEEAHESNILNNSEMEVCQSSPAQDPPRLELMCRLAPSHIKTSSTLEASIDKAMANFGFEYGISQSHSSIKNCVRSQTLPRTGHPPPIPPRSYFRPRSPDGSTAEEPKETGSAKHVPISRHRSQSDNRVPSHWVEKILEESITLRSPTVDSPRLINVAARAGRTHRAYDFQDQVQEFQSRPSTPLSSADYESDIELSNSTGSEQSQYVGTVQAQPGSAKTSTWSLARAQGSTESLKISRHEPTQLLLHLGESANTLMGDVPSTSPAAARHGAMNNECLRHVKALVASRKDFFERSTSLSLDSEGSLEYSGFIRDEKSIIKHDDNDKENLGGLSRLDDYPIY